ncbi:MAG TPA: TonB-dependent receptor [Bryobacteraceae bacterium]|jgi:hypothetical protein|nr:TonB-dependent receptor [Bryobacteraceae bacterium]
MLKSAKVLMAAVLGIGSILMSPAVSPAWSQTTNGSVTVTVLDPTGASVPGAQLEIKDVATNDIHKGITSVSGTYTFVSLVFGTYQLTISCKGFQNQVFDAVEVQTARQTEVHATLKVGSTTDTVTVSSGESPLVDTTSSMLADTLDTKQVVNLPVTGRNVMSFAFLVPGFANTGVASSSGTWNNMPGGAVVGADFDGTPGISNRFRSGGFNYGTTAVQPRIEDVGEMTISTGQLDLSGTGTSAMRIAIVTRHGTNQYHGRLYEDFRNTVLNANSWSNNARGQVRNILKLNDFGVSVGGPILKNKLFFFGTYAESIQPGSSTASANVLTPGAQQGIFSYKDAAGNLQSVNVMQIAGNAGFPTAINPIMGGQLQKVNGVLNQGTLSPTSDPNFNSLSFQYTSRTTTYYPTIRVDYAASQNLRFNLSYAQTKNVANHVNGPQFPGGIDPIDYVSNFGNNRIAGFGVDWTIRPTLINQFHAGYMYQLSQFDVEDLGLDLPNIFETQWPYGQTSLLGGAYPRRPISSFYPLLSFNDSLNIQRGNHSISAGVVWYREQDHYWNGPGGEPNYSFGVSSQDPLGAVFNSALSGFTSSNLTNAQNLYAELTGRVSSVGIAVGHPLDPATKQYKQFGAYNLDEVQASTGLWLQDSWRLRPNLTLNYGLRWDFVGDDHDVNGGYSTLPSLGDIWGPTPVGKIFSPGTLGGVASPTFVAQVHAYKPSYLNPSPGIAAAWNPQVDSGVFGKILGGKGQTVIRAGYSLRHYAEGAQNFWAFASNSGQFFFQSGSLTSNPTPALGNFTPGLLVGQPLPAFFTSPATYSSTVSAGNLFPGNFYGMNPNLKQPYLEQWNFGIQRSLGRTNALEVRYVGNLGLHQWLADNLNEVNIFENGFLGEFQHAQANLTINQANGKGNSFAFNGLPGQSALPIFGAAFGTATSNYTNGTFITNLQTGAAGALANSLAGNTTFLCNMVGTAAFPACVTKGTFPAAGAYPINFWQINPFAAGRSVNYLDSAGMSNYHGLQVEFRQRPTHGAQFSVNYTWAHSLGISAQNGIQGQGNNIYYTDRNYRLNYGPGLFDIRHVLRASGTYDLPFGKGKKYLNHGGVVNGVFGGWTLGTIFVIQSGNPAQIGTPTSQPDGYNTVNNNDSGVYFNGITARQLQSAVGVYHTGNPWVLTLNPSLLAPSGIATPSLAPATTPGVWGYRPIIYGPHWYNDDLSINKTVPIREGVRFVVQTEFLNVTNHPTFNLGTLSVRSTSFAQQTGTGPSQARRIEFRANIEF